MKTNISIQPDSNLAMWFLGPNSKEIQVSLTFENPGPVEIDFEELCVQEQQQVLRDLKMRKIKSSVKYDDLFANFAAKYKPKLSQPKNEQQVALLKKIEEHKQRQMKVEERINYLLKQSTRAIKATLKDEKDSKVLRMVQQLEQKGRHRKLVLVYLQERLNRMQEQIIAQVNKPKKTYVQAARKERISYDVVESEQEIIKFSVGEPLKP